jgi:hypothetical protein
MTRILLTGMGAGAAATLLFASVASGVGLSLILFSLAPLPIMIATLGSGPWAGLVAAVSAAAMLGGAFGASFFPAFLTSIGGPAWCLAYLALLGRPAANGGSGQPEWYPPGRLVLWAAVLGAGVTAAALATMGDEATIRRSLKHLLEAALCPVPDGLLPDSQVPDSPVPPGVSAAPPPISCPGDMAATIDRMARMLPSGSAVIAALTQTGNLWLAGVVMRRLGRLPRPWPDLTTLSLPPLAVVPYGASLAGALLPGLPGLIAGLFEATLTMAFTMVGLAVVHAVTRGVKGRTAILWGVYSAVFFLLWPVMTIIGVVETLFGLRERFSGRDPPLPKVKDR